MTVLKLSVHLPRLVAAAAVIAILVTAPSAQSGAPQTVPAAAGANATGSAENAEKAGVPLAPGYVIGPDDVLTIVFWREKDMSGDVIVRPDGKISLPLLNEVAASGLTPEQLRERLTVEAQRFVQDPNVTVIVKAINSRRVYITGQVSKPGPYPMMGPLNVLQLISMAGGLLEYAKSEDIVVMRVEAGKPLRFRFNYKWVMQGLNLRQNIELKPGDTVIVP